MIAHDQIKADLNLAQGEVTMWIPGMPNVPPQNVPVMIAQANQAQTGTATKTRVIGECSPSPSNEYSAENGLAPLTSAQAYFSLFEQRSVTGPATTTILQQPKHGVLRLLTEADGNTFGEGRFVPSDQLYVYLPEQGYLGEDSATILVDFGGGNQVKVKYFFQAVNGPLGNTGLERLCKKTGVYWKISSNLDANGNTSITSVEHVSPVSGTPDTLTSDSLSAWLSLAQLDSEVAGTGGLLTSLNVGASTDSGITVSPRRAQ